MGPYIRCIFGFGHKDAVVGFHPAEYRYSPEGNPNNRGTPMCEKCAALVAPYLTAERVPVEILPKW